MRNLALNLPNGNKAWFIGSNPMKAASISHVIVFRDGVDLYMSPNAWLPINGTTTIQTIGNFDPDAVKSRRKVDLTAKESFMHQGILYLHAGVFDSFTGPTEIVKAQNKYTISYVNVYRITGTINGTHGEYEIVSCHTRMEYTPLGESIRQFIDTSEIDSIDGTRHFNYMAPKIHAKAVEMRDALNAVIEQNFFTK